MRGSDVAGPIVRHVGIDMGKLSHLCELRQGLVSLRASARSVQELQLLLDPNKGRARVVFEACREAWYLSDLLTAMGHEVWVVDTTRVRQLGIGQHKRKNDRIDAEVLARAAESGRVPKAHVLSHSSQQLRLKLGVRRTLVQTRAQYVTAIRGLLRTAGLQVPGCATHAFLGKLAAVKLPAELSELTEPMRAMLESLGPRIEQLDHEVQQLSQTLEVVKLLCSAPGVGPVVAIAFVSVVDNAGRFRTAHQVEAYLGLVPSESSSGKRKLGAITKHGNGYLRSMLVQAAWQVLRQPGSDPLKSWGLALCKKRGKRIAVVAVARRLAGILWAMWRDTTPYQSSKLGERSAQGKSAEARQSAQLARAIEDSTAAA